MNKSLDMNYYFFWNNYYSKYHTLSKLEKKLLLAELKRRVEILK